MFKIRDYFNHLFKKEQALPLIDRLEGLIESDAEVANKTYTSDSSEIELLTNVLNLKDLTAEDVMVPRADIVAAKIDTSLSDFLKMFSQNNFSQIPIYKDTLDNVVGIVRVRDFLMYMDNPISFDINKLLKEVMYVVPSIQLMDLLSELRASTNHMALVVDEFGGIDGLVTLQDVISEIVGEMQQKRDMISQMTTKQDGTLIVDAKMLVSECEEMLGVDLTKCMMSEEDDEPDFETIGGLTMCLAERMPTRGETFKHPSGLEFEILKATPRCVKRVAIRRIPNMNSIAK